MCLVTTKPTRTYRDSVVDPPRHSSYYSAHTAGRVSLPRSQRTSYVRSAEYVDYERPRSSRVVEYVEEPRRSVRAIEYEEPRRRSRSVVRERDVDVYRASRGSVSERDVRRRSVSRVRYT